VDISAGIFAEVDPEAQLRFCTVTTDFTLTGEASTIRAGDLEWVGWLSLQTLGTGWFALWYLKELVDPKIPRVATYRLIEPVGPWKAGLFGVVPFLPEEIIGHETVWFCPLNRTTLKLEGPRQEIPSAVVQFAFPLHPQTLGKGWWHLEIVR
jgi:hypothetical protein